MESSEQLDRLRSAYGTSFRFHDENQAMLARYAERLLRRSRAAGHRSLLSLGIGHQVVCRALAGEFGLPANRYVVVEGSQAIIDDFRARNHFDRVEMVHALFEEFETAETFDAIEMGFVLEHVEDPEVVLSRFRRFLRPAGTLFVAVPNARSLHRQVGHAAGLLDDLHRLSEHDLQLGHRRYFDLETLAALALRSGFQIARVEGIQLKPATTSQLESLALSPEVQRAFFEVGVAYPDLCNALFLECRP